MSASRQTDPDAAARRLAEWIGYAWDGLLDGRISDRGYPQWCFNGIGQKQFQGGRQDLRDLAAEIVAIAQSASAQSKEG